MECELLLSEHMAIMDCDDMANIMLIPCFRPRVDKPEDSSPETLWTLAFSASCFGPKKRFLPADGSAGILLAKL